MNRWGRGPARLQRPALGLGSRPGGGSSPSGAPPASALGREFPLGHDSKMCRGRSSLPQGVSVGSPPCEGKSKEAKERIALLSWERTEKTRVDLLLALSVPVISLFFFSGDGFQTQYLKYGRPASYN